MTRARNQLICPEATPYYTGSLFPTLPKHLHPCRRYDIPLRTPCLPLWRRLPHRQELRTPQKLGD